MTGPTSVRLDGLLHEILGLLRKAEGTPLRCGIDAAGVAALGLRRWRTSLGEQAAATPVCGLALHVDRTLVSVADESERGDAGFAGVPARAFPPEPAVAPCVARLHAALQEAHPRAGSVLALRLDGLGSFEVAEALDLAPRLVRRIVGDVLRVWREGATPC